MTEGFLSAVRLVFLNEGGFNNDPKDPGGATNFGISLRFLKGLTQAELKSYGIFGELTVATMEHLTIDQARRIYEGEFWVKGNLESLVHLTWSEYVLDMCVHHGIGQGIKLLQRAVWSVFCQMGYIGIKDDGILGAKTLEAIKTIHRVGAHKEMKAALISERAGLMRRLVARDPALTKFLSGWLPRCYRFFAP